MSKILSDDIYLKKDKVPNINKYITLFFFKTSMSKFCNVAKNA